MSHVLEISVVIPTYNRCDRLARALDALEDQTLDSDRFEVIVVSDGSTDGTDGMLAARSTSFRLVALEQVNAGPSAARNRGIEAAAGELVVFLDDDEEAAPQLLEHHRDAHERAKSVSVAVIGPVRSPAGRSHPPWLRWEQAMLDRNYADRVAGRVPTQARHFWAGNSSVRRHDLMLVGGFDPTFRRAEDVELGYRLADAGIEFAFAPTAVALHDPDRSLMAWMAIPAAYGRADVRIGRDRGHPSVLDVLRRHFRLRRAPTPQIVLIAAGRARLAGMAALALAGAGCALGVVGAERAAVALLSASYNVSYYQGACEELGGRAAFLRFLRGDPLSPPRASPTQIHPEGDTDEH